MVAKNISEYMNHVKEITFNSNLVTWYRGHADTSWTLLPSVWRNFTSQLERHLTHEFLWKAKTRTQNSPQDKDWPGWMALMQHYGLPTRLLDWTKSPLIALYFAIENHKKGSKNLNDAAVWTLFPSELNIHSELDPYIFSIYNETAKLMIEPAFINPQYANENNKIIAVSSVESNLRMLVQQSAFTIHSSQTALDDYGANKNYLNKIVIPKQNIHDIALELDILGFRASNVFPDLDHLSKELISRYIQFT